ncbi:MAG TPA: glycosyl hydrolase [Thermoanaerobaculia bacterium]|nr:glycosyl hydrolase [Thermoanaerobaculia bacterium]
MKRLILAALLLSAAVATAASPKYDDKIFSGLELRGIGPALVSGRVVDIAVDPRDTRTWYLAVAAGGVWKTTNNGTTFTPVFDDQGSFSIGTITIDPNDSLTVWVGSGENNSQRSVSWGDGLYKSTDGGKSWTNVGLGKSEHIGKIVVDPRDSNVVYVAAQGPLWNPGGDRGLYKTTDGGKTWKAVLTISENTGVTDVVMDPTNPDTLYAASYQRRRHVFTLINGGPESAIYKSTDAGATWSKLTKGLPKENIGRIGLAIPRQEPKTVYAIIEAARKTGGFFRSKDGGGNFEKMSTYSGGGAQYYAEIFVDPNKPERVYAMDVYARVSDDAGKTWKKIGEAAKHVDNHHIWIDPANSDHVVMGCDGGVYESFDRTATWQFKANLPITQFYRISADDALPFYHVYGGTQDNFSLGGPSRTTTVHGILNSDWYVTVGGDGFRTIPDPKNPNIVYGESQYGGLGRFDKRTGELLDIQPQPTGTMDPLRQNWDSPLIISPHDSNRLYFAAQYLFRSDDRGNTWKPVSGDLTRRIDRNKLPVMGRVWGIDAVAKNTSTSNYGNIVSLSESPLQDGLLYVGTDDGLIQITEDGGKNWKKIEKFAGVPEFTYVSHLQASAFDANTVYAAFENHKTGDFKPYVYKSTDRGATWKSITNDLPAKGSTYVVIEDSLDRNVLFAGTEYGLFFSQNGGTNWIQLKGNLPTIAVRDLTIQKRRDDLVVGTFGRGIYILDDLKPLRAMTQTIANADATLFAPRDADLYVERAPLGLPGKAFQGDAFYTAPNPPYGAVFTYYLRDELKSLKKQRAEAESKIEKDISNEPKKDKEKEIPAVPYPAWEQLRAEERELDPAIVLVVSDEDGDVIRRVSGPVTAGYHRVAWDLRYPPPSPIELTPPEIDQFSPPPAGPLVVPGKYTVRLVRRVDGADTTLGETKTFNVVPLYLSIMNESDRAAVLAFQKKASRLQKAVMGAARVTADALVRVQHVRKALDEIDGPDPKLVAQVNAVDKTLHDIDDALNGDPVLRKFQEPSPVSLVERVTNAINGFTTTSAPTATHQESLAIAERETAPLLERLRRAIEVDLAAIEKQLNERGAPWTPGRIPTVGGTAQ